MIPLFLFQMQHLLTVDRIEGNFAIVEWKDGSLGSIERHLLPESLHEGQALILYLKPSSRGAATATSSYPAYLHQSASSIALPHPQVLELGHHYHLTIQPLRRTYVEARHQPHPRLLSNQISQPEQPTEPFEQPTSKGMLGLNKDGSIQPTFIALTQEELEDSSLLSGSRNSD